MAISLVGTASGSAANGENVTITLPTCLQDDLVCVFGGHGRVTNNAGVSTSGYTENTDLATNLRSSFSYKKMDVSPDTSVTCIGSTNTSDATVYVVMVFRGVHTSSPIDATTTTATALASGMANPPAITTVTDGAAILACGHHTVDDATVTAPTGYGNLVNVSRTESVPSSCAMAWKVLVTAGTENPSAYTNWTNEFGTWQAFTVALRPAAEGSFGDGVLSATGTNTTSFVRGPAEGKATLTGTATMEMAGQALAATGAFSMTGTGTLEFDDGTFGRAAVFTGAVTVTWVGGGSRMSSVRETIETAHASVTVH
jgi:hypothetical protein